MKTFILSILLALALCTGLSAAQDPPESCDQVAFCIVDNAPDCTKINFMPALAAPLPLPCVLEVATFTAPSSEAIESNKSNKSKNYSTISTVAPCYTERLQAYGTRKEGNIYSIHSACGGLARLQSPNA